MVDSQTILEALKPVQDPELTKEFSRVEHDP